MSKQAPDCYNCTHKITLGDDPRTCEAFPAGIPDEIFWDGEQHTEPWKGQKGTMVYKPISEQEPPPPE